MSPDNGTFLRILLKILWEQKLGLNGANIGNQPLLANASLSPILPSMLVFRSFEPSPS